MLSRGLAECRVAQIAPKEHARIRPMLTPDHPQALIHYNEVVIK